MYTTAAPCQQLCLTLGTDTAGMLRIRMERSPSPLLCLRKVLSQAGVTPSHRARGSRPSLEEDLRRFSPKADQENRLPAPSSFGPVRTARGRSTRKGSRRPSGRDTNVFRFPSSGPECPVTVCVEPPDEDEVFVGEASLGPPAAGSPRLVLTPSTATTPLRSLCTPRLQLPSVASSPALERGLCCSTPNRLRLEADGLGADSLVLGRGAFGTVVLGRWRGRKVAVKVMEAETEGTTSRRRKSLESELQARRLDHEHVVKLYAVHAVEQGYAVVIMEYVGSRNLHQLLLERRDRVLGRAWLLGAAAQVSGALHHCHARRLLHLDIKPANVLVTSAGSCKLGDFGCSLLQDAPAPAALGGTPGYQAPEVLRGAAPGPACDVYSLAILLWQLDARELPYPGQHPQTIMFLVVASNARPSPPGPAGAVALPAFASVYTRCWAPRPEDRPSAASVVASLAAICSPGSPNLTTARLRGMR